MAFQNTNSFFESQYSESKFVVCCEHNNIEVKNSSKKENMYKHIDFYLTKNGKVESVDFKGAKRKSRTDSEYDYDLVWIEIQNVRGNKGWIYGEADFIVFEREDHYIFIPRKRIVEYAESIQDKTVYHKKYIEKLYQRKNREDIIFFTTFQNIFKKFPENKFFKLQKIDN